MIEGNLLIRASAGTGKTFSLATRFIRLMLFDGVEPERIVALTFSRAAAQEIYEALLKRLWKAAASAEGVATERRNLLKNFSEDKKRAIDALKIAWTPATFADLLRKVVNAQHTGSIATLDSFILRLVGNFPLEFGFQNAVEVLDTKGEMDALDRAKRAVLERTTNADEFTNAFYAVRRGTFSRMCTKVLDTLMEDGGWRKFILEHPECRVWTKESMCKALGVSLNPVRPDLSAFPVGRRFDPVEKLVKCVAKYDGSETFLPSNKDDKFRLLLNEFARNPNATSVSWTTNGGQVREFPYGEEGARHIREGIRYLMDVYLMRKLEVVGATIRLFALIDGEYDAATRRMGKLTFRDFTDAANGGGASLELENLQFRFDSRLDHWALDEFQDTSEVQWSCLRPLVESAADGEGGRSVIAVGDLKQSIYMWRGGDDKPFEEMMGWDWFTEAGHGRIEDSKISYRYGKRIADFINLVFGAANLKGGRMIPPARSAAVDRWLRPDCWLEHQPDCGADGHPKDSDYVKVVAVKPKEIDDPEEKSTNAARDAMVESLYRELQSVWKAHVEAESTESVGVLVRNNQDGAFVADYLRRQGLPVVWEGLNAVADMPVVQAVISLLRLSEHPGDTFAWTFVSRLLPVCDILFPGIASAAVVSSKVTEMLSHQGLARTLRDFCNRLCEGHGLDGLSCERLHMLVRQGVDYERQRIADGGMDGFVRFLAACKNRENAVSSNVIRILTVHRSKGLTLDRVFVPLFESSKSSISEPSLMSVLFGKGHAWVLPHLAADVLNLHSELAAVYAEQCDARLLENLRLYYVALTRARKAMYVFCSTEEHKGLHFGDIIVDAVADKSVATGLEDGVLFEDGIIPPFVREESARSEQHHWTFSAPKERLERVSPSRISHGGWDSAAQRPSAATLFEPDYGLAARHGVAAHARYQKTLWAEGADLAALPKAFQEAFVRPSNDAVVWRERSYEIFRDHRWETGQFDRVVFSGPSEMRTAVIYDFKTNAKATGETDGAFAERMRTLYAAQMTSYRWALSRLTGIPRERIATKLLLEATGAVVPVAD